MDQPAQTSLAIIKVLHRVQDALPDAEELGASQEGRSGSLSRPALTLTARKTQAKMRAQPSRTSSSRTSSACGALHNTVAASLCLTARTALQATEARVRWHL